MRTHRNPDGSTAEIGDRASIGDRARIWGNASIWGDASIWGNASIEDQWHVAWVDRVGSGNSMTLHRTMTDGVIGWQINAGCRSFAAPTIAEVCELVRVNVKGGHVEEWSEASYEDRARWARQVRAALKFLAASVVEDES